MSRDATTLFQRDEEPERPSLRTSSRDRFAPGAIIAGRYRIVALLGRGGMGEVYRADDIRLDQQVALKFLPSRLESDPETLERFLGEVRLGRQVSHPNVCRLYDVGDHEGHHFLTMEYVDGEDLASLLQRIGKLPSEKAIDIARGIAAGLAAAHAIGIVHRDLKPSNVMIDGKGRARITDFGLAALNSDSASDERLMGTPAYMAPEQFLGAGATQRSDVYALGLILYECLTGRRVHEGASADDIIRKRLRETSSGPISGLPDLDPVIDRLLRKCVDPDPMLRPASAQAVLASMPGGDPLAAALAAGETPSPELVAAAEGHGNLSVRAAWTLLAVILLATIASVAFSERTKLPRRLKGTRSPEGLAERAAEIAGDFGAPAPRDTSWWTSLQYEQYAWMSKSKGRGDWDAALNTFPSPLRFTYRQSPQPMIAYKGENRIDTNDPPLMAPGMARVSFDHTGRLVELAIIPADIGAAARTPPRQPAGTPALQWPQLFALAELPMERFTPATPSMPPPMAADTRRAWTGTAPGSTVPLRIEAASFEGRPVWFSIDGPWRGAATMMAVERIGQAVGLTLQLFVPLLCAVLAYFNIRQGRGDRRVTLRLAVIAFAAALIARLFRAHHAGTFEEAELLARILGHALFVGASVALGYLGLEPYVRRYQPHALISWVRLFHGRVRDALVGRDLLIGIAGGTVAVVFWHLHMFAHPLFGYAEARPMPGPATMLGGANHVTYYLFNNFTSSLLDGINIAVLLVICRVLLKKTWLANLALHILITLMLLRLAGDAPALRIAMAAGIAAMLLVVLRYGGVLGVAMLPFSGNLYAMFPTSLDFDSYYFVRGLVAVLIPVVIAVFAFVVVLAGRPAFGEASAAQTPATV